MIWEYNESWPLPAASAVCWQESLVPALSQQFPVKDGQQVPEHMGHVWDMYGNVWKCVPSGYPLVTFYNRLLYILLKINYHSYQEKLTHFLWPCSSSQTIKLAGVLARTKEFQWS